MVMDAISIKSYNTFIKTLNDLVVYGFIKMVEKSKNQYSSNIIALSKIYEANDKALDKAIIKHSTKQSESTVQSIDSINKPIYNNTNLPINNINEAIASQENLSKENPTEILPQSESVEPGAEERKKVAPKKEKESLEISNEFLPIWTKWKDYRKDSKIKNYAGVKWEQIALNKLIELSNNNPKLADEIVNQSIENNYNGLFPLKNNSHGNTKTPTNKFNSNQSQTRTGRQILAERLINSTKANGESGSTIIDVEAL
jgi:hypothetical protein